MLRIGFTNPILSNKTIILSFNHGDISLRAGSKPSKMVDDANLVLKIESSCVAKGRTGWEKEHLKYCRNHAPLSA